MNSKLRTVRGGTRLLFDGVEVITRATEQMHENIAATSTRWLIPADGRYPAHGLIASSTYSLIRGLNSSLRQSADTVYGLLPGQERPEESEAETRAVAAINGALGDHLETTGNPLATEMTMRVNGKPLPMTSHGIAEALPAASPNIVVLVHGLGLSDLSWSRGGNPDIGERLEGEMGGTAVYLRYNTGRHISTNGRQFAQLLEQLCESWPVAVESISLVGHSMGGLLLRSACWYAEQDQANWLNSRLRVVCLGSPHHGSPLEKAGNLLDRVMLKTPYTAPLALGRKRSVGIKDLRHGYLRDEDWLDRDPDQAGYGGHEPLPLPSGAEFYFIAASVGQHDQDPLGTLLGDLLVRQDSALGEHTEVERRVNIKPENCRVFYENHHFDLLDDEQVALQIVEWLRH